MTIQKIKILDPHEAIKIAAGEVIERPAHIIKELIENSIDAGAKHITLHLQNAGKDFIKISDDGCGMSELDAKLCFTHHATSKIQTVHDLPNILTYGFRGEALSSIACVSHVELITKTETEKLATQIKLQHAKLMEQTQTSHPTGTTLIISDLFENIPARKKFLKSDETEWNLIVTIIQAFALRYPEINFKVFHNDQMAYNCSATVKITTRCAQLWQNNLHDQLLELTPSTHQNITISGAISNPHYHRFNRGQIFTFVNNRWVKNTELFKGILKGYDGVLPLQKFPAAFLFVEIDPHEIDINIHPKKEEVKFLHPGIVQKIIETCVKNCLGLQIQKTLHGEMDPRIREDKEQNTISNVSTHKNFLDDAELSPHFFNLQSKIQPHQKFQHAIKSFDENEKKEQELFSSIPSTLQINAKIYDEQPYSIVGQFKKTYIMIEKSDQLVIIDQHGAHERILYERFKNKAHEVATIQLLFPHIVKLHHEEIAMLQKYQQLLSQHGILFDQFSDHEIIIQATPVEMSAKSAHEIIQTVLKWLEQHQNLSNEEILTQLHEKVFAEKACKAACKAGDTLSHEQIQNLLNELQNTENNFCCPHGRPTMWNLPLKEIEKHFKRDYAGAKSFF